MSMVLAPMSEIKWPWYERTSPRGDC